MATGPRRRWSNATPSSNKTSTPAIHPTRRRAPRVSFAIVSAIEFQLHFGFNYSVGHSPTNFTSATSSTPNRRRTSLRASLHQLAHFVRFGAAQIDDEVGVALGDLRLADALAFQARRFDQSAGEISRRIAKHRTRIGITRRLAAFPLADQLAQFGSSPVPVPALRRRNAHSGHHGARRQMRIAIAERHFAFARKRTGLTVRHRSPRRCSITFSNSEP